LQAQSRPAASNTQVFACCGLRLRCLQILRRYWAPIVSSFVDPPASKVISLGAADDLVQGLMGLAAPEPNEPSSQTEIMRRYYTLKRENKLSELTLSDGEALARLLVEHAIDFANTHPYPCRGIGGSIEMLTVTSKGVAWVQPPVISNLAPAPPVYRARYTDSDMLGNLDGTEWLRGRSRQMGQSILLEKVRSAS